MNAKKRTCDKREERPSTCPCKTCQVSGLKRSQWKPVNHQFIFRGRWNERFKRKQVERGHVHLRSCSNCVHFLVLTSASYQNERILTNEKSLVCIQWVNTFHISIYKLQRQDPQIRPFEDRRILLIFSGSSNINCYCIVLYRIAQTCGNNQYCRISAEKF